MGSAAQVYVDGVRKKLLNYFAAWLPDGGYRLGDYGVLDGNLFVRLGTLTAQGVGFVERPDTEPMPLELVSDDGVAIVFKGAGEVNSRLANVAQGDAGIAVEFASEGAFIVSAPRTYEPAIEDLTRLEADILKAHREGRWKAEWAVLVRVVHAPQATILVSRSSQGRVEFAASGTINPSGVSLGDTSIGLTLKFQSGDIFRVTGGEDLTPFFQLARLRRAFPWRAAELAVFRASRDVSTGAQSAAEGDAQRDLRLEIIES